MNPNDKKRSLKTSQELLPSSSPPARELPPSSPPGSQFADEDEDMEDNELDQAEGSDDVEEGEDLFGSDMENDYQEDGRLDRYDMANLDDGDYDELDIMERRRVDEKLDKRDQNLQPISMLIEKDKQLMERRRRRKLVMLEKEDQIEPELLDLSMEDLADLKADNNLAEWLNLSAPRRTIKVQFTNFLLTYIDSTGNSVYGERIQTLVENNWESLTVDYFHLCENAPILAYFLANCPLLMLTIMDLTALDVIMKTYPEYDTIQSEIHCRISSLPTLYTIRELRHCHLNSLVKVSGVVSRRSSVLPMLKYAKFQCSKCQIILGPFYQDASQSSEITVHNCHNCSSRGPFLFLSDQTVYRNYQKISLQETPGTVPPGRLPRNRDVILVWDLVDSVKPGDEIEVTGIFQNNLAMNLHSLAGFPVFQTVLEANHILKKGEQGVTDLTKDEEKEIQELAKDPNIGQRIITSIAPSIFGHEDLKTSIALSLFSGVTKVREGGHRIRGDINILLIGDPGTAKSQFLKYTQGIAHRCVYATGQGASAVGLTASVRKDPVTREWALEGGALVLADRGVCLINEFDKMNDKDRTSIHEAMEQQSISISKAGIVTTLHARCSIIAAANPIRGRYNAALPLTMNVELTEPILSRFDLICVVKDTVDPTFDFQMANFVLNSHRKSHIHHVPVEEMETNAHQEMDIDKIVPVHQDLLKKYILYARGNVEPKWSSQLENEKLANLYSELRHASMSSGGHSITIRHLESIIRLSEAYAKMHLREWVQVTDLNFAITTFLHSFVDCQKGSMKKLLFKSLSKYLYIGSKFVVLNTCLKLLNSMVAESLHLFRMKNAVNAEQDVADSMPDFLSISVDEFATRARELAINDLRTFLNSKVLAQNGFTLMNENDMQFLVKNVKN